LTETRATFFRIMLQLFIDKDSDPARAKLRAVIEAQTAYERSRVARSCFVHFLAMAGIVIWIDAIWPDALAPDLQLFSLVVFGGALFPAVRTAIEESVLRRRYEYWLKAQGSLAEVQRETAKACLRWSRC